MNIDGIEAPGVDIWTDGGKVCLVITDASIIEHKDQLTPGLALSPQQALKLVATLTEQIEKALYSPDEKDEED